MLSSNHWVLFRLIWFVKRKSGTLFISIFNALYNKLVNSFLFWVGIHTLSAMAT